MERDILRRRLKKFRHQCLRHPDIFMLEPALDARAAILGLVEDDAGLGLGLVAHAVTSLSIFMMSSSSCLMSVSITSSGRGGS